MFCKREVMKKIKFDTTLWPGEDSKFVAESKKQGFKIAYNPDLIIYHRRRPTLKALIKQIFNYGRVGPLREKFSDTIKRPFFSCSKFIFNLFNLFIIYFFN
jgi:GT2 family glycosyltransferase